MTWWVGVTTKLMNLVLILSAMQHLIIASQEKIMKKKFYVYCHDKHFLCLSQWVGWLAVRFGIFFEDKWKKKKHWPCWHVNGIDSCVHQLWECWIMFVLRIWMLTIYSVHAGWEYWESECSIGKAFMFKESEFQEKHVRI